MPNYTAVKPVEQAGFTANSIPADLLAAAHRRASFGDTAEQIAGALVRANGARPTDAARAALKAAAGDVAAVRDRAEVAAYAIATEGSRWCRVEQGELDRGRRQRRAMEGAGAMLADLFEGEDFATALAARYDLAPRHAKGIAEATIARAVATTHRFADMTPRVPPQAAVLTDPTAAGLRVAAVARAAEAGGKIDDRHRLRSVLFNSAVPLVAPKWRIKGLFPEFGVGLIVGETGSGKTFLAIYMSLCVAYGLPFFGCKVRRGPVVYFAAEGGAGVIPRFRAAEDALRTRIGAENLTRKAAGLPPLSSPAPITIVTEAVNLGPNGDRKAFEAALDDAAAQAGEPIGIVIIDTWHAALGGAEENSASEAGLALDPLREAADARGLMAVVVAHPGKDVERGMRGSNAIPAASDGTIIIKGGEVRTATVTKVRDGPADWSFAYALDVVQLGIDEDGDPWTTCSVRQVHLTPAEKMNGKDRAFMEAVVERATGNRALTEHVRATFYASQGGLPDAKRMAFNRALEKAVTAGRIREEDGFTILSESWPEHSNEHTPL